MTEQPSAGRRNLAKLFDRIAEVALVLLVVAPFTNPIHTWPIPSFYSEWLAAVLALVAVAATLGGFVAQQRPLAIPGIVALPLLLAGVAVVQSAFGHVAHPRQALLFASTLVLAGAMMVTGHSMARTSRLEPFAPWLARFLVAGCLLQCVVLLLQRAGIAVPWLVFPPAPGVAPTGSLAQGNHQADYLWLGVASTLYLMARAGRLSVSGIAMVLGIAMMSVLPASRSVLLYPLGLALAAMVMWRANRRVALWRYLALLCLATLPLMLVADRLGTMMASSPASDPHTLTERLAATGGERVRAGMYQVALEETMTRPIVGHGLGAAPWVTFQRADRWPDGATPVVAEHIHNVVLQWLLEFGVPLTVVALALLAHWLRRTLQETNNPTHWWGLALLMVVAVHSQLEYPLWLTYFLLPASWLMGALAPVGTILAPARRHHAAITVAMLLELATIGDLWRDYRELERVQAAGSDPRQVPQAVQAALELDRTSLLAPNALLYLVARMESDGNAGDAHWALCSQALHVSPRTDIVTKCAAVARVTGRSEEANRLTLLLDSLSRQ